MEYLSSIITSTSPEEQQKELDEKLAQFTPYAQEAIRDLLARGISMDEIRLPTSSSILYIAPDFDDPWELELLEDDSWDLRQVPRESN